MLAFGGIVPCPFLRVLASRLHAVRVCVCVGGCVCVYVFACICICIYMCMYMQVSRYTCVLSYEEEDTCVSYEEEDTCLSCK